MKREIRIKKIFSGLFRPWSSFLSDTLSGTANKGYRRSAFIFSNYDSKDFFYALMELSLLPFSEIIGKFNASIIKLFGLNFCVFFIPDFIVKIFARIDGKNIEELFRNAEPEDANFFASSFIAHKRSIEDDETARLQFRFLTKQSRSLKNKSKRYLETLFSS